MEYGKIEKKGIIWELNLYEANGKRVKTIKKFYTKKEADKFAKSWKSKQARREKFKSTTKKIGDKIKSAYKEYQSPAAKKKRAKEKKARDKKMLAAQKQWGMGGVSGPRF